MISHRIRNWYNHMEYVYFCMAQVMKRWKKHHRTNILEALYWHLFGDPWDPNPRFSLGISWSDIMAPSLLVGNVIIPPDELIFFKMVKTTNQYIYIIYYIIYILYYIILYIIYIYIICIIYIVLWDVWGRSSGFPHRLQAWRIHLAVPIGLQSWQCN